MTRYAVEWTHPDGISSAEEFATLDAAELRMDEIDRTERPERIELSLLGCQAL